MQSQAQCDTVFTSSVETPHGLSRLSLSFGGRTATGLSSRVTIRQFAKMGGTSAPFQRATPRTPLPARGVDWPGAGEIYNCEMRCFIAALLGWAPETSNSGGI